MDARARILITGLVQGVFFRREITDHARRLGISGWVKNLQDGRVEALAEGEKARLDELIRFCHVGPRGAIVRRVEVEWSDYSGEFRGFRITKEENAVNIRSTRTRKKKGVGLGISVCDPKVKETAFRVSGCSGG